MLHFNLNRLRAERVARGLTQKDMSKEMGWDKSPNRYGMKETGKIRLTVEDLCAFMEILGLSKHSLPMFFTED